MRADKSAWDGYTLEFVLEHIHKIQGTVGRYRSNLKMLDTSEWSIGERRQKFRDMLESGRPFVYTLAGHAELALDVNDAGVVLSLNSHGTAYGTAGYSTHHLNSIGNGSPYILYFPQRPSD